MDTTKDRLAKDKDSLVKGKDLLIKGASIITVDDSMTFIEKGAIGIDNGVIEYVGPEEDVKSDEYIRVIDGEGMVAMPGFVNTHTHAAMSLLRGYADDLPLMEWLSQKIWPLEDKLVAEDVYWGTKLSILEMIKSGTTTFADMYFFMEETAKAVEETGIRASLSRGIIGVQPNAEEALRDGTEFAKRWNGAAGGRITTMLGPHAPYTCPPEYLERVIEAAAEAGLGLHTHLCETESEISQIADMYRSTPIELMEKVGLFKVPVLAAHCVHLTDGDIEILAANGVGVAHNPGSNMKLGSGIAPVKEMIDKGVHVGLGTDGASSNNNLDMLEEMRLAALLQKVARKDPTVIPAETALRMATIEGAKALGLSDRIGSIERGKKADIILINFQSPHLYPKYDLVSHVVYSANSGDIDTVIVDGRILMEKRTFTFADEDEVTAKANEIARRLTSK